MSQLTSLTDRLASKCCRGVLTAGDSVDAGVAIWAEGASISALRIPRPPLGRVMKLMEPLIIVDVYI